MRAIQCNFMCVNSQASFRFILLDMYDKVSSISSTGMAIFKRFVRSSNFEKICLLRIFSMGETNKFNFKPKISLFVDIRHLKYVWCMSKVKDKRNCDSNLVQKTEKKRRKKRNYEDCHSHKKINLPWTMHTNNNNVEHIAHTFFLAVLLFNLSLVLCIFVVVLLLLPLLLLVGIYLFGFGWCRFAFTFMPINQYCFA